jgi:hypothetical protein
MAPVIDLSGGGEKRVSDIESSGLAGAPVTETVGPDEQVRYALVSKRGDVTVERDGETTEHSAGRGYRTVTVVTDVRLLVVVGGDDGGDDRVVSIPVEAIDSVETHQSFLSGGLRIETAGGEEWSIPCKGDLDGVVEFVRTATRAWRRADRFAAEAGDLLDDAERTLESGDTDAAFAALDEAEEMVVGGRDRLAEYDVGSRVPEMAGLTDCSERIDALRRRAHATVGDAARRQARTARDVDDYEDAVAAYADARDAYERALTYDGDRPDGESLRERLSSVHGEEAELATTPQSVARAAYERADSRERPLPAARAYRVALDRYRELLGLSWGPTAFFVGDSDAIEERILDIVDGVVDARVAATRRALSAADTFEVRGATDPALSACAVAEAHLEAARDVVTELAPDREGVLDVYLGAVEDARDRIESATVDEASEGGGTVALPPPEDEAVSTADESATAGVAVDEGTDEWASLEPAGEDTVPEAGADGLAAALGGLDREACRGLVADTWRALGWETTVFGASPDQYDVVAALETPVDLRMAVWVVHDPEGSLSAADVDRCSADQSPTDVVALVTTATVPDTVRERADDHGVKLLDRTDLTALLESEGLTHLLSSATPSEDN